jgi:hypothetical protein
MAHIALVRVFSNRAATVQTEQGVLLEAAAHCELNWFCVRDVELKYPYEAKYEQAQIESSKLSLL